MAHSNVWSNIIPAGSDALNTADDQLRQLRLDIQERMDEVVSDWTADPVVPLGADVVIATGQPDVAVVYTNANLNALTGVALTIAFAAETLDTGNPTTEFHSNSVNNSRLTITTAAYYRITGIIEAASGAGGASLGQLDLTKNGSVIATTVVNHIGGVLSQTFEVHYISLAAAADYYELKFTQASGNTWTIQSGANESYFMIEKLTGTT